MDIALFAGENEHDGGRHDGSCFVGERKTRDAAVL